ncbi:MAG: DUF4440 domain-containing protein [Bacteroidetes bacterium]|nr:DUF4440 domain-containing protein [Bacteroidota bacterium]
MGDFCIKNIDEATEVWKAALESGNADAVTSLYHESAVLWGTLSRERRDETGSILEYFVGFAAKEGIKVEFTDELLRDFGEVAINTGQYIFSWKENGKTIHVPARYSFVFMKDAKCWVILDHHSSLFPELPFDSTPYQTKE